MKIRAKMMCDKVNADGDAQAVAFSAVTDGSDENKSFAKYTPSARLEMWVDNPATVGAFVEGNEYYVDISPAAPVPKEEVPSSLTLRELDIIATKALRVKIDEVIQAAKALIPSRETALVITKLQEAVMWAGMNLKAHGEKNPYPNSRDTSNAVVDPTAQGLKL